MSDIDIDLFELKRFIETMRQFQTRVDEQFKVLEQKWAICDESWQGKAKDEFQPDFESTTSVIRSALDNGEDALKFLEQYRDVVIDFEEG